MSAGPAQWSSLNAAMNMVSMQKTLFWISSFVVYHCARNPLFSKPQNTTPLEIAKNRQLSPNEVKRMTWIRYLGAVRLLREHDNVFP
jgi:hypothetical protein